MAQPHGSNAGAGVDAVTSAAERQSAQLGMATHTEVAQRAEGRSQRPPGREDNQRRGGQVGGERGGVGGGGRERARSFPGHRV